MPILRLCAKFNVFPDNHLLGPEFTLAAFHFKQLGTPDMIANDTAEERGLSIPNDGVAITLPLLSTQVQMRIGTFNSPLDILVADNSGTVVSKQTVPFLNTYKDYTVSANEIFMIKLIGGGFEGLLASICIEIPPCMEGKREGR